MIGRGEAYMIVKDLQSDEYTDAVKLEAIKSVYESHSYYFVYKEDLWEIIEYLLERIEKQDTDTKA